MPYDQNNNPINATRGYGSAISLDPYFPSSIFNTTFTTWPKNNRQIQHFVVVDGFTLKEDHDHDVFQVPGSKNARSPWGLSESDASLTNIRLSIIAYTYIPQSRKGFVQMRH